MMLIMWFSGLRGAIAYALSLHLEFKEETRKVKEKREKVKQSKTFVSLPPKYAAICSCDFFPHSMLFLLSLLGSGDDYPVRGAVHHDRPGR